VNPLEVFILAFSGVLVLTLVSNFVTELTITRVAVNDEVDLINVVNIYERGYILNASFNTTYNPSRNGTLIITSELIMLNNATKPNNGLSLINCDYDILIIRESGLSCLKH